MLVAAVGVGSVFIMAAVSLQGGTFCPTCLATYVLVIAYAAVAWRHWRQCKVRPWSENAVGRAGVATLAAYLVLLIPGQRTPSANIKAGDVALDAEANRKQAGASTATNDEVSEFLNSIPAELQQGVSDALAILRGAPDVPVRQPRALLGSSEAAVRITDFTDVMCGHCADLHITLGKLRTMVPPEVMAIEARHFPLDGGCNGAIQAPPQYPVRCLAAKAQICLEGHPQAFEFSGQLFKNSGRISEALVYELAAPYMAAGALQSCVSSPETAVKLAEDIEWAVAHQLEGTPLVLVNGKKAAGFGPLLYALALAKGNVDHPAFQRLPKANPHAHMH
jgi:serine/threonine-protein kinase